MEKTKDLIYRCYDLFKGHILPPGQSEYVRNVYSEELPDFLKVNFNGNESLKLYDNSGCLICNGFTRVVVSDYGAFVEFTKEQSNKSSFMNVPGQDEVIAKKYLSKYKFVAMTTKSYAEEKSKKLNEHSVIILYQLRDVDYGDFKPEMLYVPTFQVQTNCIIK